MTEPLPRYDLLIVPADPTLRVAPRAAEALLRSLAAHRQLEPSAEAVADEWAEIYCRPGVSAHELFIRGTYEDEEPVYLEAAFRLGTKAVPMPWGAEGREVTFFIEFRGCRYQDLRGPFKKRLLDIAHIRGQILCREHEALPPHREVPEDEKPKEKPRRERSGLAGTRVEEW